MTTLDAADRDWRKPRGYPNMWASSSRACPRRPEGPREPSSSSTGARMPGRPGAGPGVAGPGVAGAANPLRPRARPSEVGWPLSGSRGARPARRGSGPLPGRGSRGGRRRPRELAAQPPRGSGSFGSIRTSSDRPGCIAFGARRFTGRPARALGGRVRALTSVSRCPPFRGLGGRRRGGAAPARTAPPLRVLRISSGRRPGRSASRPGRCPSHHARWTAPRTGRSRRSRSRCPSPPPRPAARAP